MTTEERAREIASLIVFGRTNVRLTAVQAKRERFEMFQHHISTALRAARREGAEEMRERCARVAKSSYAVHEHEEGHRSPWPGCRLCAEIRIRALDAPDGTHQAPCTCSTCKAW
jgi:hypothetical protein